VTPQAPSHSRLPRAARERQMLETAHALFAERGYAAVTMDEIAAAVRVTVTARFRRPVLLPLARRLRPGRRGRRRHPVRGARGAGRDAAPRGVTPV
jgi:hypothetical protein